MKVCFSAVAGAVVLIILAIVSSVSAQNSNPMPDLAKRAITEKDLFNFVWIADPQISPDGLRAVFTRVVTDEKHTGYETFDLDRSHFWERSSSALDQWQARRTRAMVAGWKAHGVYSCGREGR